MTGIYFKDDVEATAIGQAALYSILQVSGITITLWDKKMRCKIIIAIQIALIPLLLQVFWQLNNNALPIADAGDHFRIAYLIYLGFKESFAHGINYFFHSGGKPILFSAFAAPFVSLFHVSQLLPIISFVTIVQSITTFAYFFLFSYKLDPIKSALFAGLLTTSPYIFGLHTQFMPVILWHMWFVLFLCFLLRSNNLSKKIYSTAAGIALGLTILTRPAESIILLTPTLMIYLYYLHKIGRLNLRQLLFYLALLIATISGCSLTSWFNWNPLIGYSILCIAIFMFMASTQKFKNKFNALNRPEWNGNHDSIEVMHSCRNFFMFLSVILGIWLIYYARHIYYWTYDNSFGAGAKTNDQVNLSKNIILIFYDVISIYGLALTTALITLACFAYFHRRNIAGNNNKILIYLLSALGSIIIPMLIAYSLTGTSDNRRIFLGIVFLFICTSYFIALKPFNSKAVSFVVWSVLAMLFVMQSFAIISVASGQDQLLTAKSSLEKYLSGFRYRYPGPNKSHDAEVVKQINSLGITNSKIAVFSLGLFTDKVLYQAESLRYVTLEIDRSLEFGTLWGYTNYEPYLDVVKRLMKNDYKYVLLEDLDNPITDPDFKNRMQPHTFFVTELLALIRSAGANNISGLDLVGSFDIGNRKQYLFRVNDSSAPIIYASSQLREFSPSGLLDARQPGWHSANYPIYPQTITLKYRNGTSISEIGFLHQDGGASRGPKSVEIHVSKDGSRWQEIGASSDVCTSNDGDWYDIKVKALSDIKFIRVVIYSNCGSPDLLTLRGLRIK